MNRRSVKRVQPWLAAGMVLLLSTASCASGANRVVLSDEEIYIIQGGAILDETGDTKSINALNGWYCVSPGRMVKILESTP